MYYRTEHSVRSFGHFDGGELYLSRYPNGEVALVIGDPGDGDYLVATVALDDAPQVGPAGVWLKGWSENKGLPEALEAAGLLKRTGERHPCGFVEAEKAQILPVLAWDIAAFFARQSPQT